MAVSSAATTFRPSCGRGRDAWRPWWDPSNLRCYKGMTCAVVSQRCCRLGTIVRRRTPVSLLDPMQLELVIEARFGEQRLVLASEGCPAQDEVDVIMEVFQD